MKEYTHSEMQLAKEIANALKDHHSLLQHLQFVKKYRESFLREMLVKALAIPEANITNSRGALYTALVKRYGSENSWN